MTQERIRTADEIAHLHRGLDPFVARVSRAVLPMFAVERNQPTMVGCCVLLRIDSARFMLTAAHVLDEFSDREIWVGFGDRLCHVRGRSDFILPPDGVKRDAERYDAAVLRLDDDCLEQSLDRCLTPADLDVRDWMARRANYLVFGYPETRAKMDNPRRRIRAGAFRYLGADAGEERYDAAGIDRLTHVAVDFNVRKIQTNQGFRSAPSPKGLSGTGIWAVPRAAEMHSRGEGKLVAILIEHLPPKRLLIGTRVSYHLELIRAGWPDVGATLPRHGKVDVRVVRDAPPEI